jgi:hypothetical protein
MTVPVHYEKILRRRPGGQIVQALDWAINGGCYKWCNDITYAVNTTLTQLFITGKDITINTGITVTLTQLRPLIIVCQSFTAVGNGVLTASGKGCNGGTAIADGSRFDGGSWPYQGVLSETAGSARIYCLCGAGGGGGYLGSKTGGGAYGAGGAGGGAGSPGGAGEACDLTDEEIQSILFSPFFDFWQIGFGGGGGGSVNCAGGDGGGSIIIIAKTITIPSTASVLATGIAGGSYAGDGGGGGGGGFIALIGHTLDVDENLISSDGGAGGADLSGPCDGGAGGNGVVAQIEV